MLRSSVITIAITAALCGVPTVAPAGGPAPHQTARSTPAAALTTAARPTVETDARRYEQREKRAAGQAEYQGGDAYIVIGSTTLGLALIIVGLLLL